MRKTNILLLTIFLFSISAYGQGPSGGGPGPSPSLASGLVKYASDPYTCNTANKGRVYFNTTSNVAKVCDGTSWKIVITTATSPGGSTTQVQYNNSGAFGGSSGITLTATQATLASPLITKLGNLTTNGFVKTSGSDGTLSVDTNTYENPLTFSSPLSRSTNTISCPTCGVTGTGLNQFASTTSAQLRGVLSDENGTGAALFDGATSPSLITPTLGVASSTSETITGTGGAGFLQLLNQSSAPSTPTSASRIFFDSSNRLSWIGTNGFVRTFDGTANTANRIYVLPDAASNFPVYPFTITYAGVTAARTVTYPDANFTVARTDAGQTFTGNQTFGNVIINGTLIPTATGIIQWGGGGSRSVIAAPSDGVFTFSNNTQTDFSRLQLGGTTSSFPAIKRNAAAINFRLADDSADAAITSAGITASGAITTSSTTDSTTTTSGALQVAGGAAIRKRVFIDGITTSAGVQTAVLCQSSGGEMIADSVACLASSARFKYRIKALNSGLNEILSLRPVSFFYKPEGIFANNQNFQRERVGLIAEDVAKIDPRLVGFEKDGITPRTVGYEQIVPVLIKAVQEQQVILDKQQKEIEELKQQIAEMKKISPIVRHHRRKR
jgi:hypothetical protein